MIGQGSPLLQIHTLTSPSHKKHGDASAQQLH